MHRIWIAGLVANGQKIVYATDVGGAWSLHVAQLNGKADRQLTTGPAAFGDFRPPSTRSRRAVPGVGEHRPVPERRREHDRHERLVPPDACERHARRVLPRPGGGAWTQILSAPGAGGTTVYGMGLSATGDHFQHLDGSVAFDNFRLNAGALTCPSWWRDEAPDVSWAG